jgi:hypothetical protein
MKPDVIKGFSGVLPEVSRLDNSLKGDDFPNTKCVTIGIPGRRHRSGFYVLVRRINLCTQNAGLRPNKRIIVG